jgi:hypothetical protein
MIIEKEMIQKITIKDVAGIDIISLYLEDQGIGRGKAIITCWENSWTAYWGGMGNRTISEFILSCDNHYLAKNFSRIPTEIEDPDKLIENMKELIVQRRRELELNTNDAREYFDAVLNSDTDEIIKDHELLFNVYGEEWWHFIPKKPNPDYVYLCKILTTIKEALSKG